MATKFKTLREFLYPQGKKVTFEIPNYQRGYKWAVKERDDSQSSVEHLLTGLIFAWKNHPDQVYFLQGITVSEDGNKIEIIDGQQRITTLYLILRVLGIPLMRMTSSCNTVLERSRRHTLIISKMERLNGQMLAHPNPKITIISARL